MAASQSNSPGERETSADGSDPRSGRSGDGAGRLALIMGGGGARAAYQVGFLRAVARRFPDLEIPILTGVSAGAINAVHLAAHPGTFREAVDDLTQLWLSLTMDRVFQVDSRSLALNAMRWGLQLVSGGLVHPPGVRSLMETSPLRSYLGGALAARQGPIPGITEKIEAGRLRALAVSTSSYSTGLSITWVQGDDQVGEWTRPLRRGIRTRISLDHVMASAAIPLFFPAVRIGDEWYGDGGLRLAAPLSPALQLGGQRLLAISTRFDRMEEEAERPVIHGHPPPAQIIGSLLNSIFLDLLDQDAWRVEAMNRILSRVPRENRGHFRVVKLLTLRPSRDLGRMAQDFEAELPGLFRFLVRGLGTRETESPDMLSFLLFEPGYLARIMEMGERDGEARMGEVEHLLAPQDEPRGPQGVAEVAERTKSPRRPTRSRASRRPRSAEG
jgi:NTE family protein